MKRRGILGWFGAGAAAAVAPPELVAAPTPVGQAVLGTTRAIGGAGPMEGRASGLAWSEADAKALSMLRRKMRRVERDAEDRKIMRVHVMAMCDGHAPHVAPCRSWAPWFKAHASMRWRLAMEAEDKAEELRRSRSIAGAFSNLIRDALPDWMQDKLADEDE